MSRARDVVVAGSLFLCSGLAMAGGGGLSERSAASFGVPFPKVAMPGILELPGKEVAVAMPVALPVNRPAAPGKIDEASGGSSARAPGEVRDANPSPAVDRPSAAPNPFAPWKLVPQARPACK